MNENELNKIHPMRIGDNHEFGVSPFGVFCFECNVAIGTAFEAVNSSAIRMHVKRRKHTLNEDLTFRTLTNQLNCSIKDNYSKLRDFDRWISDDKLSRWKCSCGDKVFRTRKNVLQHVRKMTNKTTNDTVVHQVECKDCVKTTCGRILEISVLQRMMRKPIDRQISVVDNSNVGKFVGQSNHEGYIPIESTNERWINTTLTHIKGFFNAYKRVDENLNAYLPSLKLITINFPGSIITRIHDHLELIEDGEGNNTSSLLFFLECAEHWVKVYCREHVNILNGKVRFELQSYFDETILVNAGYNLNFNMRENEIVVLKEMKTMIILTWKLHEKGLCNGDLAKSMVDIKNQIKEIETEYNNIFTESAAKDMISQLLLQKYFHCILIETKESAYDLHFGHYILMLRLFKFTDSTRQRESGKEICMRSCGEFGRTMSLHLHIYRLASASLIACTKANCWERILDEVKGSYLSHTISPMINKVKQMSNEKIQVRKKQVKENGDIVIDEFEFPKCKWSMLVPSLVAKFHSICKKLITKSEWECIVDLKNDINVSMIKDENGNDREDILHYDFYVNVNGKVIMEKDLIFEDNIADESFEKLTALVMISLHGLGVGSTRIQELFRLQQHQVYWKGGNFYYLTISNKRKSSNNNNKKTVTHKLPAEISRYLLLYDYAGRHFAKGREQFLYAKGKESIENEYVNKEIYSQFAEIFELNSNCDCLIMRHLYTSICNYLFPANTNTLEKGIVSTISTVAEMSGHSADTHEMFYASSINKEGFFDKYHHNLGADLIFDNNDKAEFGLASRSEVRHYLQVLFGLNAEFLSKLQEEMVLDACNNQSKHTFCSIGCGGGKSLSWMIPTLRKSLKGVKMKMSVVVVPYCFLLEHHVSSCSNLMGICRNISIEALTGKDIDDNILPNILRDKESLPVILFVSLEAIRKLVECHFLFLQEVANGNYMEKIYIDESHTILYEINFRQSYIGLAKLAGLNVPIVFFSGTFQRSFIKTFLKYMFGESDKLMYNFVVEETIFGDTLMRIEHSSSENYLMACSKMSRKYVKDFTDSNVHIIVSTKDEGITIFNELKRKGFSSCEFICSESNNQSEVAKKWNNDSLKILITTTLGIVGNESSKTGMVCIVGLHYNLASIVQAYGRIRFRRRTKYSKCSIFTSTNNNARLYTAKNEDKTKLDELIGMGIVSDLNRNKYRRSMTSESVHEWLFNDQGCRLVSLATRMGFKQERCSLCDICTNTCVSISARAKRKEISMSKMKRQIGIQIIARLKKKCICCNRNDCDGNCVVRRRKGMTCYHCLGAHSASKCKKEHKNILKGKACYSCYMYNYSQECIHHHTVCSGDGGIKERLRGLIQYDYIEKTKSGDRRMSFIVHLAGIFGSEEAFFGFLYKYRDWK